MVEVVETFDWLFGEHPGLLSSELEAAGVADVDNLTADENDAAVDMVRGKYLAAMMLSSANGQCYGQLKIHSQTNTP